MSLRLRLSTLPVVRKGAKDYLIVNFPFIFC